MNYEEEEQYIAKRLAALRKPVFAVDSDKSKWAQKAHKVCRKDYAKGDTISKEWCGRKPAVDSFEKSMIR